ncbi:MAG TPA: polyprenyl synthetase family protein [Phycisphaerae bacterium]|nr:polyprenyl synthetase family protein [Phycisphaerae bacterium]HQL73302.1 polyprenyl synthetase family protein [Phycisphaerae bacterium]
MSDQMQANTLGQLLGPYARLSEQDLAQWVVEEGTPSDLGEAMRYCVLGGGKRLRPALVFLACQAVGGQVDEMARRSAVAVELVHCYSLVHDDLPAMDDDVLRRGRPTAHVRFGEAMAILAGDALLTRAFAVLCEAGHPKAGELANELARGAGSAGMIAGQVADMNLCQVGEGPDALRYIHLRKTAALITAAARMGGLCGQADERALAAVTAAAENLGLAFQVFDDVLDVSGQAEQLGKTPGKDARAGKRTYVAELGLQTARDLGQRLSDQAAGALNVLDDRAQPLRTLIRLLAERTH